MECAPFEDLHEELARRESHERKKRDELLRVATRIYAAHVMRGGMPRHVEIGGPDFHPEFRVAVENARALIAAVDNAIAADPDE